MAKESPQERLSRLRRNKLLFDAVATDKPAPQFRRARDAHPQTWGIGLVYSRWYQFDETGQVLGILHWPGLADQPFIGGRDEFLDLLPASYLLLHSMFSVASLGAAWWNRCSVGGLWE